MLRNTTRNARLAGLAVALVALTPAPARALPLISEVFYDAVGSDNGFSFVEISGAPGTVLDGLSIEGVNGANGATGPVLVLTGQIPSDGLFLVADDAGDGTTLVAAVDLILDFDFQNGPDSIVLRTETSVIDAVGYGVFGPDEVFAGEGEPAPDPPAGSSLARVFADVDTDNNLADFAALEVPTPGSAPFAVIPEPRADALMGFGLLLLGGLRRRSRRIAAAR